MNKSQEPSLDHKMVKPEDFGLIGRSEIFIQTWELIKQVAPTHITVLITGESGTGKEQIAKVIHQLSPRKQKPLFTVNCGAIPEGILESELFGHEKGSFTGAIDTRKGYFELADEGTLFLDEIGEMPLAIQVKLLRVLESMEFLRVGGSRMIKVNVRVIAATNKDLEWAVERQEFRKDLFYRLNAVRINVPPLRERREDIRLLATYFAEETAKANHIQFEGFTEEAFQLLESYSWPGNIRELRNLMERLLILEKGKRIDRKMLELHLEKARDFERKLPMATHKTSEQAERELIYRALVDIRMAIEDLRRLVLGMSPLRFPTPSIPIDEDIEEAKTTESSIDFRLEELEKQQIIKALDEFGGNRRKAAQALGISERTLYRKLKEYGIE